MIPVTIIGGYLGAGKTTLINHLLRHAEGRRLAVLVNEFGALSIDQDLIEAEDDDLISIAGGCICCSFGDNLIGALMELAKRQPRPDHIVIEASGVAIPAAIAGSISLLADYSLNGIVVLADAETVRDTAQDTYLGDTILRQLADADLVVATKTDLVSPTLVDEVVAWLDGAAPQGRVFTARLGHVPPDVVLGSIGTNMPPEQSAHSDALFESTVLEIGRPVDAARLAEGLASGDLGLIRAKGFVEDMSGNTVLIQLVGRRVEVAQTSSKHRHAMVCIGASGALKHAGLQALVKLV